MFFVSLTPSFLFAGQVPVKDRGAIVDAFNRVDRGPQVMLLSLAAGGVGLNLVGANHLFLLDLHWNPQLESQVNTIFFPFTRFFNASFLCNHRSFVFCFFLW